MAKYRKLGRTSAQRKALLRNQITALINNGSIMTTEARAKEIQSYLRTIISQTGELAQFDPRVWVEVVEQVTVFHDGRVVFRFKDGREITT